ncbi:MAG: phosphoribosylformylglycinamidine cyclo-ligase [Armatimonadota bacterium]
MSDEVKTTTYADSGVDIDAGNEAVRQMKQHIRSTFNANVVADVGSFGGMFSLAGQLGSDPVLVSSMDGVGTKLKVAFMMNKHETIGRDLVWHCINDILVQGARPLVFLDYFATGKLEPSVAADVVKGLAEGCRTNGCVLIGGETAEMPGMYQAGEYDLAGCIVGIVDRAAVIDGSSVQVGDVLVGLASDGLHTNGYSLARKVLFDVAGFGVDTYVDSLGTTVGDALLAPHRCYAYALLPRLVSHEIRAMAHITGGGFVDNIPRSLPDGTGAEISRSAWTIPALFTLIQESGNVPLEDMMRTFNMGIGMVVVVPATKATALVEELNEIGERACILGSVVAGEGVRFVD